MSRYEEVAGERVTLQQGRQIKVWKQRAGLSPGEEPEEPLNDDGTQQLKRKRPLYLQVARRHWIKRTCPRCLAGRGADVLCHRTFSVCHRSLSGVDRQGSDASCEEDELFAWPVGRITNVFHHVAVGDQVRLDLFTLSEAQG